MAKKDGSAVSTHAQSNPDRGTHERDAPQIVKLNFSLTKKSANRVMLVKRWEERSKSKSLELTGRS